MISNDYFQFVAQANPELFVKSAYLPADAAGRCENCEFHCLSPRLLG